MRILLAAKQVYVKSFDIFITVNIQILLVVIIFEHL